MNCEKLPKTISAEELLSTPLPPVKWIIPDLLPAGLALFAGPSKAGKSWLTLWLCLQVAQGKLIAGTARFRRYVLQLRQHGVGQPLKEIQSLLFKYVTSRRLFCSADKSVCRISHHSKP